jgi:nitrogen fixation-related uncharacterized protein
MKTLAKLIILLEIVSILMMELILGFLFWNQNKRRFKCKIGFKNKILNSNTTFYSF